MGQPLRLRRAPGLMPYSFPTTGHRAGIVGQDVILRAGWQPAPGCPVTRSWRRVTNPPQVVNHCCPNCAWIPATGQGKPLIPRASLEPAETRFPGQSECCPNCWDAERGGTHAAKYALRARPAGSGDWLSCRTAETGSVLLSKLREVQNLIWTGVVVNLPHNSVGAGPSRPGGRLRTRGAALPVEGR